MEWEVKFVPSRNTAIENSSLNVEDIGAGRVVDG
jgi:hypothetical protein